MNFDMPTRRRMVAVAAALWLGSGSVPVSGQDALVRDDATVQVSANAYVIPDANVPLVPNVGIVIGTRATLVIDTGLGPRNGETIRRVVDGLTSNDQLYVVTTHYHPEHSMGASGVGEDVQLVMPRVQQEEMADGGGIRDAFASRSVLNADLLRDVPYPTADILFEDEITLDLGGLTARVFTLGAMHTRGDTMVWIEEERVLFTGDIAMQEIFPAFANDQGSVRRWLDTLDLLEALNPQIVIGAHTPRGNRALIVRWREYLEAVEGRVAALKVEGMTVDEATELLGPEFEAAYPTWRGANRVAGAVRAAWNE
jgi:glyoxylase-like metal-dependent hydrolase (beta-lactamase superfamily II)